MLLPRRNLGAEINWALHSVRCLEDERRRQKRSEEGGSRSRRKIRDSNDAPERKAKEDDERRPREGWQKSRLSSKEAIIKVKSTAIH